MDDPTAAKLFELLRSQQILIGDLSVEVQALSDCLSSVPDFERAFEQRKAEILGQSEYQRIKQSTLDSIESMIRALRKSNGGA